MIIKNKKRGFSLIELLVVITIIGILATGGMSVYTTQIQKARDSTRTTDLVALRGAIEAVYMDNQEYPHYDEFEEKAGDNSNEAEKSDVYVTNYLPNLPKDPKNGTRCNGGKEEIKTTCVYLYAAYKDDNDVDFGMYMLSTGFENKGKVSGDAAKDGGFVPYRYEIGNALATKKYSAEFAIDRIWEKNVKGADGKDVTGIMMADMTTDKLTNPDMGEATSGSMLPAISINGLSQTKTDTGT